MVYMRSIGLALLAGWFANTAAYADVVFSDPSVSTASYTQSAVFTTPGSSLAVSNSTSGLQVTVNANSSGSIVASVAVVFVNNAFAYNPSAQGPLNSLTFTESTSYSASVPVTTGTPWSTGCGAAIEQDGKYYVAFLPGPSYYSGSSGLFTCSQTGMTAADFVQYSLSTGSFTSGNPNFSGNPMTFGTLVGLGAYETVVLGQVIGSLSYDLVPASSPPVLAASPSVLNFSTPAGSSVSLQQTISIANTGGGSAAVTVSTQSGSAWIGLSASSGSAAPGSSVLFTITVNPQGLSPGNYRDVVQFASSAAATVTVPVTLLVTNTGPILFAGPAGFLFTMVQGAGSSVVQNLTVANQGSAGSTLSWTAGPSTGPGIPNGNFLNFGSAGGQLQAGNAVTAPLSLNRNASSLAPGVYYQLIQVAASDAQNSPQYATAVLNVLAPPATLHAQVSPAGLLFTAQAGAAVLPQQFTVNWSSTSPQVIVPGASTANQKNWLAVSPSDLVVTSTAPGVFSVSVSSAGMAAGVYTGSIPLNGGALGSVNVTLILTPALAQPAVRGKAQLPAQPACTPATVVLTETGIPASFNVPAGWPADLIATMSDDCGNLINSGAVSAAFSDGEPPLHLDAQGTAGQYLAVWQPSKATNSTIALTGTAPSLAAYTVRLSGFVTANQAPVLSPNGILNNLNPLVGGALAPGTVAAAFGNGLTASQTPVSPGTSPLPGEFQDTELVIGGSVAPLYFLSNTQLNVEVPTELAPLQQFPAVAVVNNALSVPITVPTAPIAPGVAVNADGSVIAQDSNYNLITPANPAHPGEAIVIYLVGMGATNPAVASGNPAPGLNPGDSLASAVTQPVVKVGDQTAQLIYAGLTPGGIGLYQINFYVPTGVTAGTLSLGVSQSGVNANPATLPVAVP